MPGKCTVIIPEEGVAIAQGVIPIGEYFLAALNAQDTCMLYLKTHCSNIILIEEPGTDFWTKEPERVWYKFQPVNIEVRIVT